jgi:two-component system chemotaxis sensor kinase CheA
MAINNEALQQQLVNDLLLESVEGLDRFDRALLALENGCGQPDTFNVIFRVIHTIKGTAGCIGLGKIESVAHVGENLLSLLRDGNLKLNPAMIAALLEYSDALKEMLRCLEMTGQQGDKDYSTLLEKLKQLQTSEAAAAEKSPRGEVWGLFGEVEPETAPASPVMPAGPAPAIFPEKTAAATAEIQASRPVSSISDTAIRVDVGQLDKLMNLVGELVLARNQIIQFTGKAKEPTLLNATQRLNLITTELQESVMKTRMQPIGNVWSKFPRIVRDVAHELGKRVKLVMEGQETELDRTIIEAIKDPLTHVIRNAIDHGIEPPAVRSAAGKPDEGMLILRAFHEGGQVNIEIMDDGQGINVARVKQKALEKSLLAPDQAAVISDRDVLNLVFLPGFSTAEKVTNVSGRGVGMDVVKTNIEKIGGSVDLFSEMGQGTTLKIKIPLTLAIIPALIVTSGGERFAIPQVNLLELVRLESEQARKGIEVLYGAPVYRLRGQLLPLVYLNRELKLYLPGAETSSNAVQIVVLQADGRQFGLVVDEINDTEEIVVKPLGKQLKGISCFAGATIMGDGRVALILDVLGLAQEAKVISETRDRTLTDKSEDQTRADERQTLLLFDAGENSRLAIPLSTVARLEEFPLKSIERAGGQEVVQYRGQILPLIQVSQFLPLTAPQTFRPDPVQVVVYSESGRSVGLVVSRINDIVQEILTVRREAPRQGISGSAVIQDKVTDLLDVPGIIRAADPDFYRDRKVPS